jgi:hypothetical protein
MSGADILTRLLSDALTGKPVKLGIMETPAMLAAIKGLSVDPVGRMAVFDAVARACLADPALKAHLLSLMRSA